MLQNYLKLLVSSKELIYFARGICATSTLQCVKNKPSHLSRQSKVMNKLFGSRISGRKKLWIPSNNQHSGENVLFKASSFGKSSANGSGKRTLRRIAVLNKLFMKNISDLLANEKLSEAIGGFGMQITRVKISQDFSYLNVYWTADGSPSEAICLQKSLKSAAGLIRHELSQLCLMSEVPIILFIADKNHINMNRIENIFKNMDLKDMEDKEKQHYNEGEIIISDKTWTQKEFFGESNQVKNETSYENDDTFQMLPNCNSILGLDRQRILSKICAKMRKSKSAWEEHNFKDKRMDSDMKAAVSPDPPMIDHKNVADIENFRNFLANRREKKESPERKKFRATDQMFIDLPEFEQDSPTLPHSLKKIYEMDDFINDDPPLK